jgi:asparagine synthase (glutamine-hydrolysing)
MVTLLRDEQKAQLFRPEVRDLMPAGDPWVHERKDLEAGGHWLSCLQRCDMNSYLPLDILTKVDRMSMAHSLEARVPLLDHKVVEFAATIPAAMHIRGGKTKNILKRAMRGIVPDPILDRPKRGFAIPLGRWFSGQGSTFVKDLLLNENSHALSVFNAKYIDSLIAKQDDRNLGLPLWTLVSFELWCRTFLDRRPGEAPGLLPATNRREARVVTVTPNKSFSMARGI